jgi:two-component system nitrogen regulation sensor histidine kinase NtrY
VSLRWRMLLTFGSIVVATVALISYAASVGARKDFQTFEWERIRAVVAQFQSEFELQGNDLGIRASAIAHSAPVRDMALALSSSAADPGQYLKLAGSLAADQELDFLELLDQYGAIISSAQSPASFGMREAWLTEVPDWNKQPAFKQYVEADQDTALVLLSVRELKPGDRKFYVVAGRRIDSPPSSDRLSFLQSLMVPQNTRVLLWEQRPGKTGQLLDASGAIKAPADLINLVNRTRTTSQEQDGHFQFDDGSGEIFNARTVPVLGRNSSQPLAVFIVASSRKELTDLQGRIRNIAAIVAMGGILLSIIASGWWAGRISRPIEELSTAAQDVAAGQWERKVDVGGMNAKNEVARLIASFNQMTDELLRQRDRALQAERVAAWRELARRLAHELKNPLFPLQITIENLTKARQQNSPEFNEIFTESTATLLTELNNLKKIIGRFNDFSKMPTPQLQNVDLNQLLTELARLFAPQLNFAAKPIALETNFMKSDAVVAGDPDLLRRAFENLILNAIDAMPDGGALRMVTSASEGSLTVEIADTGEGLTEEEASRLFTPYYTTKRHGTGLGLAIVQSVISDHGARISVSSQPAHGTTFRIEFRREAKVEPHRSLVQSF